jgi:hypothetical protein
MGKIKWTFESISEYVKDLGFTLVDLVIIKYKKRITIVDNFGYYYIVTLQNLLQNKKPCMCEPHNPFSIQNIKLWCKINNKFFELISEIYESNNKKLKWRCLKEDCGEIFNQSWSCICSLNQGCSVCAGKQVGLSNCLATRNPKLAAEWHPTKNSDLTPYDVTCGSGKKVWWQCLKNSKHEWISCIDNRKTSGCPYCSGKLPSEDYNLLVCNPTLCEEWNYEKNDKRPEEYCPSSNKYVWWKCKKCGHEWNADINNRSCGKCCPKCDESKGEKRVDEILNIKNIYFTGEYIINECKNKKCLPFDFAIFKDKEKTKLELLVEYDGILHYINKFNNDKEFEKTKKNDEIKNQFCIKNNIKLLRIPYWDFDNIEEILNNESLINNNIKEV